LQIEPQKMPLGRCRRVLASPNRAQRPSPIFALQELERRVLLSVSAPLDVQANNGSTPSDLVVSWNSVSGAVAYNVWRNSTDNSSTATEIAPGVTGTSFDDATVTTGNTYYYWVTATDGTTPSGFSGEASATAGTLVFNDTFGTSGLSSAWSALNSSDPNNSSVQYTNSASTLSVETNASTADATNGSALAMSLMPNGSGGYNSSEISTLVDPSALGNSLEYGEIQARIMIPGGNNSAAIWPAFWLMGDNYVQNGQPGNWPQCGEIDVFENDGADPATIQSTLHGPVPGGGHNDDYNLANFDTLPSGNFDAGYHIFSIQWGPNFITFSVDGNQFATETPSDLASGDTWEFNGHPFFMILDVCEGAPFAPGSITSTQTMYVDYVRAYSLPAPGSPTVAPGSGASDNVVAWDAIPGATDYGVWRNTTNNSATATELTFNDTSTSYDDTSAQASTTYYYWVTALNNNQASGFSSLAGAPGSTPLSLTTPATSTSVNVGSNYTFDWTGGSPGDTVQIWVEGGPTNSWTELASSLPVAQGSYTWNTTGVAHGWYYAQAWDVPASGATSYAVQSPNYLHLVAPAAQAPTISLTNPGLAGDQVILGNSYTINWSAADGTGDTNPIYVQLWVYSGNTGQWAELPNANYLPATQGSYAWDTTGYIPGWYSFAIHATNGDQWSYAVSPGWLDIVPAAAPTISFVTPGVSQTAAAGGTFNLQWNILNAPTGSTSQMTVQIWAQQMVNGSPVWTEIAASVSASGGSYNWTVPNSPGAGAYYAFSIWLNWGDNWWAAASPNWLQVT
jgi:beta-glucanase (GH16 family)